MSEIISFIDFKNMSDEEKYKLLNSKDYEIERLKKREKECIDHYLVQCKYASEMEDKYIIANNIINGLEKTLDENVELTYVHNEKRQYNKTLTEGGLLFRDYIKSRLKELKGSDKE